GQGCGVWYSANSVSVFEMIQTYLRVTGDFNFLNERVGDETVFEHMKSLATNWRQLVMDHSSVADYGGAGDLLECVPTYIHGVASLNAANAGMMRALAELAEHRGDGSLAAQLRKEATRLADAVRGLYVPGEGVWKCLQPDGKYFIVRHVYDFAMTARWIPEDLTPSMRREMIRFAGRELITKYWIRALSLMDPAAPESDRPDHGPMGAYDAWPALMLKGMNKLGYRREAFEVLHHFEKVTHEGPFSQSHELLGRNYDAPVRVARRGGQTTNEVCGSAFADVIIGSFFGFQPDLAGRHGLVDPGLPRGFEGRLIGLRWGGKLYNIISGAHGVSMKAH
ncbi:MAG: hypothetical protein ACREBW_08270, partial [Candidatus Micrarchaeaceae archaeon]